MFVKFMLNMTWGLGAQLSHMIEVIRNDTGINWKKLHLIGFSIGSHLVGYAGHNLRMKGLLVPRITGQNRNFCDTIVVTIAISKQYFHLSFLFD